jgi:phosphomethylpyrimidine synthase
MKITQEVRDFAAKQEAGLLNTPQPFVPIEVEGREQDAADAEAGMAEMSRVYEESGRELYIGANGREHD